MLRAAKQLRKVYIDLVAAELGRRAVGRDQEAKRRLSLAEGGQQASAGTGGTLRRAAVEAGIPAVTLEAGEPLRLQLKEVEQSVNGIRAVMHHLDMIHDKPVRAPKQTVFYKSLWLRAEQSGVLLSEVKLGEKVKTGDILGAVTDPITNRSSVIRSTVDGQVIGMAVNQMVMPGFAAYHVGIATDEKQMAAEKMADSVVAEALEPVAETMKEAAREAAQSAAQQSDDPNAVSAAAREAVKEAAKEAPRLLEEADSQSKVEPGSGHNTEGSAPGGRSKATPLSKPKAKPAPPQKTPPAGVDNDDRQPHEDLPEPEDHLE